MLNIVNDKIANNEVQVHLIRITDLRTVDLLLTSLCLLLHSNVIKFHCIRFLTVFFGSKKLH